MPYVRRLRLSFGLARQGSNGKSPANRACEGAIQRATSADLCAFDHLDELLLGMHVHLQLWVKVRENWRNRMDDLRTLGYEDKE